MGVRNFIDRVFTVISDLILKLLPASKQEKQAFAYYKVLLVIYLKFNN